MNRPQGTGDRGEILTDAMLAALPHNLRPITTGGRMRAGCPFHGSDRQRSLTVTIETGRFQCFSCGVWGYTEQARADFLERSKADRSRARPQPWQRPSGALKLRSDPKEPEPLPDEWCRRLEAWRSSLPEAAEYLDGRRIPLELVRQLGGAVGTMGGARRLVLPHTNPAGELVSLYGRRLDGGDDLRHYHLPERAKGWLNAPIVADASELWICEGPFDALALMAAGIPHAVAVFGVQGIRWNWLPPSVRRLVLAFDCDETGRKAILEHAPQAILRGLDVLQVMPSELGGAKDIAEAWQNGTLRLTGIPAQNRAITGPATVEGRLTGIEAASIDAPMAHGASDAIATEHAASTSAADCKNFAATARAAEVFAAVRAGEGEALATSSTAVDVDPENRHITDMPGTGDSTSAPQAAKEAAKHAELLEQCEPSRDVPRPASAPPAEFLEQYARARDSNNGPTLRELVAAIPEQPPAKFPADRWADYLRLARRFVREHGAAAQAAGWDELALFGLPDPKRPWEGGALWSLAGCEIREVTTGYIRGVNRAGASCSCWRQHATAAVLPWPIHE